MSSVRRTFWRPAFGAAAALLVAGCLIVGLDLLSTREYEDTAPSLEIVETARAPAAKAPSGPEKAADDDVVSLADALRASALQVSFQLKYDAGDPPCSLSEDARYSNHLEQSVLQRRCLARGGWLLSDKKIYVPDVQIHPRFIHRIWASLRDEPSAYAYVIAYLRDADGMILELDRRLRGARPLAFSSVQGPYHAVSYAQDECRWGLYIRRTLERFRVFDEGHRVAHVGAESLIVGVDGIPIGLSTASELPLDSVWRGSPLDWPHLTAKQYKDARVRLASLVQRGLPRVHLRFRSPKKDTTEASRYSYLWDEEDDESVTDLDATGVLIDGRRLLVLAGLRPSTTARLEAVEVHLGDGRVIPARHLHSLRDYGAFLATVEEPIQGALVRSELQPEVLLHRLLLTASVAQRAERSVLRFGHARVHEFTRGFRGLVVPDFPGDVRDHYLFLPEGDLVALAMNRRDQEERPSWRDPEAEMLPVVHLRDILRDPASYADPSNKPRAAERERRLAWLGVELQPLDAKLARANDVAHLTEDGQVGALIAYVYVGSPAFEAGLRPGDILIRLLVPNRPKPISVGGTRRDRNSYEDWLDEYDDLPDSSRSRSPRRPPWPSVESKFNLDLTSVGLGRRFTAEYVVDGAVRKKDFRVAEGPPHFEAAPHYEAEGLGLTVRDLTYEVRRHYQLDGDAPGVVVAEVERGRPAAVAGVLQYEILTQVNGEPVADVASFEKATKGGGEMRLTIRGTSQERIVKLRGQ